MKIQLKVALMSAVLLFVTSGTMAQAVVEQPRPLPTNTQSPVVTQPPEDAEMRIMTTQAPAGESDQQTLRQENLQARIAERKLNRSIALNEADKQRVAARCSAAQGKIRSLEGKVQGIETSRRQVYSNLLSKLNNVAEKLSAAGIDTVDLESQIAEVNTQIDDFYVLLADYKQAVADLGALDCQADPEAFKATLEAARESQSSLRQAAQAIRQSFTNTISQTLQGIRQQLEVSDSEGAQE